MGVMLNRGKYESVVINLHASWCEWPNAPAPKEKLNVINYTHTWRQY